MALLTMKGERGGDNSKTSTNSPTAIRPKTEENFSNQPIRGLTKHVMSMLDGPKKLDDFTTPQKQLGY